jgi:hypothetical protein
VFLHDENSMGDSERSEGHSIGVCRNDQRQLRPVDECSACAAAFRSHVSPMLVRNYTVAVFRSFRTRGSTCTDPKAHGLSRDTMLNESRFYDRCKRSPSSVDVPFHVGGTAVPVC